MVRSRCVEHEGKVLAKRHLLLQERVAVIHKVNAFDLTEFFPLMTESSGTNFLMDLYSE